VLVDRPAPQFLDSAIDPARRCSALISAADEKS
jgi:hypothetical protein